jgi:hypothetical protein
MDRVAVKLEQDLAPMDQGNGDKQVRSRSMIQQALLQIDLSLSPLSLP